jgi:hypothetical protein
MTPEEKAQELVDKYQKLDIEIGGQYDGFLTMKIHDAKQCALIAVDEIIKSEPRYPSNVDWDDVGGTHQYYYEAQRGDAEKYWEEVKSEIEAL